MDLSMEIWRNKLSGKFFIYLRDTGHKEGLFVTPLGGIKSLEKVLFEEVITENKAAFTEAQERRYQEYVDKRRVYVANRIVDMVAEMEPYDREEFVLRVKDKEERWRRFEQEDDDET
jgi:hypothetical protein